MIGRLKELMHLSGGEWVVSFTTGEDPRKMFDQMKDKPVKVEIKKPTKARTKTMNDFCWAMCTDIGNAIRPPVPKEEVYRHAIRDVGEYEPLPIREDVVETFRQRWESKGIGWFVDVIDDAKFPGYKKVFAYYGSSTYDTVAMSRLIDYLKQDMENMGLQIPISKEEEERLRSEWEHR
jgi:hypothetical protein